MKTAVEWIIEKILKSNVEKALFQDEINQAKEMEKEQIMWAHESGIGCIDYGYAEDYYNETFKSE